VEATVPVVKSKHQQDKGLVQEEAQEPEEVPEIFAKHLARKITKYENFNHKVGYIDSFNFSWSIHGYNILGKFLPVATKIITS
jgi:hypothetical protein